MSNEKEIYQIIANAPIDLQKRFLFQEIRLIAKKMVFVLRRPVNLI